MKKAKTCHCNSSYKLDYFSFISIMLHVILTLEDHKSLSKLSEHVETSLMPIFSAGKLITSISHWSSEAFILFYVILNVICKNSLSQYSNDFECCLLVDIISALSLFAEVVSLALYFFLSCQFTGPV